MNLATAAVAFVGFAVIVDALRRPWGRASKAPTTDHRCIYPDCMGDTPTCPPREP
mgnify:CR=1 FL=1